MSEEAYEDGVRAIINDGAQFCRSSMRLIGGEIRKSGVIGESKLVAYSVLKQERTIAYLMAEHLRLPCVCGLELKRGWVDKEFRRIGLFVELMEIAANGRPLIADREGVTKEAFNSLVKAQGFVKSYCNQGSWASSPFDAVEMAEAFNRWSGGLWLLVLTPETRRGQNAGET